MQGKAEVEATEVLSEDIVSSPSLIDETDERIVQSFVREQRERRSDLQLPV